MLQVVAELLFPDHIRHLGSLAEEVKVFANRLLRRSWSTTEGLVIEIVTSLLELVAESIVSVFEVDPDSRELSACSHNSAHCQSDVRVVVIVVLISSARDVGEWVRGLEDTPPTSLIRATLWTTRVESKEGHGRVS